MLQWADLCKSGLLEAKWYYSGYTPSLQEFNNNAWISVTAPVILVQSYFLVTNPITKEALQCLQEYHNIIRFSSMISRFANDLGTSSVCRQQLLYSPKIASIKMIIIFTSSIISNIMIFFVFHWFSMSWKEEMFPNQSNVTCMKLELQKMNKDRAVKSPFSETFIEIAMNLARAAQCFYGHGDGFGIPNHETKDRIVSLLIQPFPICMWLGSMLRVNPCHE